MASSPAAPLLELQRIGKRFSDQTLALDDVDLDLGPGEFVSVVGPPGCGKSTLLRIAAGLTTPTSGVVTLRTRRIGFALQDPVPLPWRGVGGKVQPLGRPERTPERERARLAGEAIAVVGLGELAGHPPLALSGGTRVRAALAGSPVLRSELFLLDAPFRALDEPTRWRLYGDLGQLFVELGFAALLSTSSVTEAVLLSRRVVVLSARPGRVVDTFEVPFEYPRPPRLLASSRFSRLVGVVAECVHTGVASRVRVAVAAEAPSPRQPERR